MTTYELIWCIWLNVFALGVGAFTIPATVRGWRRDKQRNDEARRKHEEWVKSVDRRIYGNEGR